MISYAQNHEDVLLERCFSGQDTGFYIDVGAWDPDLHSVTKHFYAKGWSGINVEPSPDYYAQLVARRARDTNLQVALSDMEGEATLLVVNDSGLSTLRSLPARHLVDLASGGFESEELPVPTRTLASVCNEFVPVGKEIDFLKVDVEGWETQVILGADWRAHRPRVLLVEVATPVGFDPGTGRVEVESIARDWEPHLLSRDYLFAAADGLNRFFVRAEDAVLLRHFETPVNALDNFVPHSLWRSQQDVAELTRRCAALELDLSRAQAEIKSLSSSAEAERQRTDALLTSTSWRMTMPLRAISERMASGRVRGIALRTARSARRAGENRRRSRTSGPSPLRVALYSGLFVRFDAVSTSLLHKVRLLSRLREQGWPLEFTVFTQASEYDQPEVIIRSSAPEVLQEEACTDADVHIFEFGMHYELFDLFYEVVNNYPVLVIDHSTTPPELVDSLEARQRCEEAIAARAGLVRATHIATDSEYCREDHLSRGVPASKVSVLHLPPSCSFGDARVGGLPRSTFTGPVHFLFVGRFVRAKGVHHVLDAMDRLFERYPGAVRLTLVGDERFSDPGMPELVKTFGNGGGREGGVTVLTGIGDEQLGDLYLSADAIVLPSYHEGYCVPMVEALFAGCYPIAFESANVPNVTGGLGTLIPCGDTTALEAALFDFFDRIAAARQHGTPLFLPTTGRGEISERAWRREVRRHLLDYSTAAYEARFLNLVYGLAGSVGWPGASSRTPIRH